MSMRLIITASLITLTSAACHIDCSDDCEREGHARADSHRPSFGCETRDSTAAAPDAAVEIPADAAPAVDASISAGPCHTDAECAPAGAGLVCVSGLCVAPSACASNSQCRSDEGCVGGRCVATSQLCQFASDCGPGRSCLDGRCLGTCTPSTTCAGAFECVGGLCREPVSQGSACRVASDCGANGACVAGRCAAGCSLALPCAAGLVCVAGACAPDTRPTAFCSRDADCAPGSVCRRGTCRASCPGGTNLECQRIDVAFDLCGTDRLCTNATELSPECARNADCGASRVCLNARCQ